VYAAQRAALDSLGVAADAQEKVFGGNFERLFEMPNGQIG
jgi:hypothetical protein